LSTVKNKGLEDRKLAARNKDYRLHHLTEEEKICAEELGLDLSDCSKCVGMVELFIELIRKLENDSPKKLQKKISRLGDTELSMNDLQQQLLEIISVGDVQMNTIRDKFDELVSMHKEQPNNGQIDSNCSDKRVKDILDLGSVVSTQIMELERKLDELCNSDDIQVKNLRKSLLELSKGETGSMSKFLKLKKEEEDQKETLRKCQGCQIQLAMLIDGEEEARKDLRKKLRDLGHEEMISVKNLKDKLWIIINDQHSILKTLISKILHLCTECQGKLVDLGKRQDAMKNLMKKTINFQRHLSRLISQMDLEHRTDIENLTKSILYENTKSDSGLEMDTLLILPVSRQVIGIRFFNFLYF
jgi:hypothetical protein